MARNQKDTLEVVAALIRSHPGRTVYYCEHEGPDGPCSNLGVTTDHFTPRCIARELGWTPQQVGASENRQYLCREHHNTKDADTPARRDVLRGQLKGNLFIGFGEHENQLQRRMEHVHRQRIGRRRVRSAS